MPEAAIDARRHQLPLGAGLRRDLDDAAEGDHRRQHEQQPNHAQRGANGAGYAAPHPQRWLAIHEIDSGENAQEHGLCCSVDFALAAHAHGIKTRVALGGPRRRQPSIGVLDYTMIVVHSTTRRIRKAVTDLNPQAKQMADESMVRTLDAQARAIWPQESELIRRYELPDNIRILDVGCGTGEGSSRLAEMFPCADVLGVDVLDRSLDRARARFGHLAPRLRFENQSAFGLRAAYRAFDRTVSR